MSVRVSDHRLTGLYRNSEENQYDVDHNRANSGS
jgi:hypothetical protein